MKKIPFVSYLIVGFTIILISIYGFFLLRYRPGLPLDIDPQNLKKIDNLEIEKVKDIEFILSQKTIGERTTFHIEIDGKTEIKVAELVPYYSQTPFPLIYLIIGTFCLAIGISVFLLRSEDAKARIFYWASLAFSSSLIITGGFYCLRGYGLSYLPGILYNFFYPLSPALLLHFSLSFSKSKANLSRFFIYLPALVFAGLLEGLFLHSSMNSSIETHRIYQSIFYVFRCYLILYVLLAILSLIVSYKKSALEEQQAQIKWIFYGLFVGLGPFILLYQVPQVLRIDPFISEDVSSLFFVFIPVALAFSIIKFKLMNVELVINRSLVYFILTIFIASLYLVSVRLLHDLFSKFFFIEETAVTLISAIAAAVAFQPARRRIQDFVDKTFFRISYDYRKSISSFNERAQKMANQDQLVDFFLLKIQKVLPMEQIGLCVYSESTGKPKLIIARDGKADLDSLFPFVASSGRILARKKAVRTEENIDFSKETILRENELEMALPLPFRLTALMGFLSLGKKKSGERFNRDDIELLTTMTGELALNLERIRLQEEVIFERAEKEKLDELNRLKTEFVSKVSHELRTPMSSIRGLAEVLQAGKIKEKSKRGELLDLVASESTRLSRLLHNILDFGKIEHQIKTYNFQEVEIQSIVKEVVELFKQRLESEGFFLKTHLAENPAILKIDQDAVKQALTNLIDNAIKYSAKARKIDIQIIDRKKHVEIKVKDKGIGIHPKEQKKIFEGFYRHPEASCHNPEGVGLGLKITKHIMEAHKGKIKVDSQPNKGSTFSLIFPK